jgi:hypothetical protein
MWRVGRGYVCYPSGDIYDGEVSFGLRDGRGSLRFTSGQEYEGEFKQDEFHGTGTITGSISTGTARRGIKYSGHELTV